MTHVGPFLIVRLPRDARAGVRRRLGLAVPAEPEQLEPVAVDPVAAATGDLGHRLSDAAVLYVGRATAA